MFVFKAAVVGAGTMGGQIAQTIAAAGIPVVLKDIDDALVQAGLDEATQRDPGPGRQTRRDGQAHGRAGRGADRGDPRADPRHDLLRGLRRGRLRGRGGARADGDQAGVFAELDAATPGHAILASNTSSLSITEIGEATLRPEKVIGFHYFYPASIMPLIEIVEGEETSAETVAAAITFAQAIRKQPITCAEVPGFVVNRILNSGHLGGVARAGGEGPVDQADRRGRRRRGRGAGRPLLPRQPARPGHGAARGRAPGRVLRRGTLLRAQGHAEAGRRRQTRREDGRRRLL